MFLAPQKTAIALQVAESAITRRLIAVRLNRGHSFEEGTEGVKAEISPFISDFAPALSIDDPGDSRIPIMTVSAAEDDWRLIVREKFGCA